MEKHQTLNISVFHRYTLGNVVCVKKLCGTILRVEGSLICFEVGEHDMEEVLKKQKLRRSIWKRRLCRLGRAPKKTRENCWRDCLGSVHLYVRFLYPADPWKSVRSSGRLDSAVRRLHQLHDVGRIWIFQRASRLAARNRQFSGHHLWSDGCDYRPSINVYTKQQIQIM